MQISQQCAVTQNTCDLQELERERETVISQKTQEGQQESAMGREVGKEGLLSEELP